jgi:hypothetical protein
VPEEGLVERIWIGRSEKKKTIFSLFKKNSSAKVFKMMSKG